MTSSGPSGCADGCDARAEYLRRRDERRTSVERLEREEAALSNARLVVFMLGAAVAWFVLGPRLLSGGWLAAPALLFLVLVFRHQEATGRRERAARAVAFYDAGLARLDGRWPGTGVTGERFRDPAHPYAEDLDLLGRGSLFELLCTARTRAGEDCLARWLLAPAGVEALRARHEAVRELRPRLDLREDLALLGEDVRGAVDVAALTAWGGAVIEPARPGLRAGAALLAAGGVAGLIGWGTGFGPAPFFVSLLAGQVFVRAVRPHVRRVLHGIERSRRDLALLSLLLKRLEAEEWETGLLRALRDRLGGRGTPPSARIARLQRLVELLESQNNQFFAPVALVLLWSTQWAFAIGAWRAENGPHLGTWLQAVGEFEALCALAAYAYDHPEDPFPEFAENGVCFHGKGLAHPLLSGAQAVRNDVRLDEDRQLLIVSGSNMSGKSTLLRTVGTNAVLALAGAPVRAAEVRLTPVAVGASLRTQDSLQGGVSRFYAEITRLRQVVDLAHGPLPLLFLLDEILHGTNSHDRRQGAEAVVRTLVGAGAVGLITTHDLALARIAEDMAPRASNVHFQDDLRDGKMSFDYVLRDGVVEKSNAIALMRAVGLDV